MSIDEQVAILMQGAEFGDEQIKEHMTLELRQRLAEGRPLRVYCGYDPTAPDLHLGHTVTMRKLCQFQVLGHHVIFVIGTFTALIGDPSDRDKARMRPTLEQVEANARTYVQQAFKILDPERTEVRYNGEWLSKLTFQEIIELAANFTVQQFLARDNFAKRYERGDPIWLHEFMYALMQGYDAVALETDVQIGATEQLFNLLAGRKIQEAFGQKPQVCITFPILVGTDGKLRMSKSQGNYIGIDEPPEVMYGKVMSIPDEAMGNYFDLVTRWSPEEIARIKAGLVDGSIHPRDAKMRLAWEIVDAFHGSEAADAAQEHFRTVFQRRELPEEMPVWELKSPVNVVDLIFEAGLSRSKSDARRLIRQGAVKLDGEPVTDIETMVEPREAVLRVGKRRFLRVTPAV
ncbi:MAG TPA: tyrosine--tRNA ligase [Anaerolineales bacterium]|nr:tyrosine--tRNA ligase [Anaerolineae bacterium]HIQ01167.1 tyrosine--tRNA ligase [Anaerolineales bacterium]